MSTLHKKLVDLKKHTSDKLVSAMNLYGYSSRRGICENVGALDSHDMKEAIRSVCEDWEHFSGDVTFPITHLDFAYPASGYFLSYSKWSGEYGRRRRELLDLLITYTKENGL